MSKQDELYQKYLRGESAIPAAPPGSSLHNYGLAFDVARMGVDPFQDSLLAWLAALWLQVGGQHGGAQDPVHFTVRLGGSK